MEHYGIREKVDEAFLRFFFLLLLRNKHLTISFSCCVFFHLNGKSYQIEESGETIVKNGNRYESARGKLRVLVGEPTSFLYEYRKGLRVDEM